MIYKGEFSDVNNNTYLIKITTSKGNETKQLLLGDSPIITEYCGDENIFKAVKYSSSTISVLTPNILFDIYSSKADDVKVELFDKDNKLKWVGYVTPSIYDQEYNSTVDSLEIECIDGLSILQYYKYQPISGLKSIESLMHILHHILKKSHCYKHIYVCNNLVNDEKQTPLSVFHDIVISELNFFDEDDEPMMMDQVLENICYYMNCTCVACGEDIYLLDYNCIKNNSNSRNNKYNIYDLTLDWDDMLNNGYNFMTFSRDINIDGNNIKSVDTSISFSPTFGKVTVKDSLYGVENILPSFSDKSLLTNRIAPEYSEYINSVPYNKGKLYNMTYRFYDHKNYKSLYEFAPKEDGSLPTGREYVKFYEDLNRMTGATPVKCLYNILNGTPTKIDDVKINTFDQYILVHHLGRICETGSDGRRTSFKHLLDIEADKPVIVGGDRAFLIFKGDVIFNHRSYGKNTQQQIGWVPESDNAYGESIKFLFPNNQFMFIELQIKWGKYYFVGTSWDSGQWLDFEGSYKLRLDYDDDKKHLYGRSFKVSNNIMPNWGLNETDGFAIKLVIDDKMKYDCIGAAPVISILQPSFLHGNEENGYFLHNFDISVDIANHTEDTEIDTDTEYYKEVDDGYVNDFDDTNFYICTFDNKSFNYSCVAYNDNSGKMQYVDKLKNIATGDVGRSEELYINNIVREYSSPAIIINLTTTNNIFPWIKFTWSSQFSNNKKFVVDEQLIDWRYLTNKIKLVEFK